MQTPTKETIACISLIEASTNLKNGSNELKFIRLNTQYQMRSIFQHQDLE
jgi:hypothetical protein